MTKKRILVTGGAGFIGSHIVDRLIRDDHNVIVIDDESTGSRKNVHPGAEYIRGDITLEEDLDRVFKKDLDAVYHLAARASVIRAFEEPEDDLHVNVFGTVRVLQKCLKYRVPRLLYASSMTSYGQPTSIPTPEDYPCRPISYYGITKYSSERYVHTTAERTDLSASLEVTSFRMFNVYGPRQSLTNAYQGVLAIFIGNLVRGEPITIFSDGEQSRDLVHVSDAVEAFIMALDNPNAYGEVFNIGSGVSHSINELADAVMAAMGQSRESWEVNYLPERPGDQRHMLADIGKSRNVLGWEPKVPFEKGMIDTVRWAVEFSPPVS